MQPQRNWGLEPKCRHRSWADAVLGMYYKIRTEDFHTDIQWKPNSKIQNSGRKHMKQADTLTQGVSEHKLTYRSPQTKAQGGQVTHIRAGVQNKPRNMKTGNKAAGKYLKQCSFLLNCMFACDLWPHTFKQEHFKRLETQKLYFLSCTCIYIICFIKVSRNIVFYCIWLYRC